VHFAGDRGAGRVARDGQSHRLLVAAPDYLAARGTPAVPQDLSGHEGIRMSNIAGSDTLVLQGPGGARHAVPFAGRFRVDHGLGAREALVAGRGIAPAHRWLVDDLLAAGRLVAILGDYALPAVPRGRTVRVFSGLRPRIVRRRRMTSAAPSMRRARLMASRRSVGGTSD